MASGNEIEIVVSGRDDTTGAFRQVQRRSAAAGSEAGEAFGENFTRDSQGRLRDAQGRFVSESRAAGERGGAALTEGFGGGGGSGGVGGRLGGVLSTVGPMLASAAAAVGVAAGAALAKGVADAMERESATAKLGAQLGLPPDAARQLGESAGRMYGQGFGESVADSADAIRSVWQSGLVSDAGTAAEIEDLSAKAMLLAQVFGVDVHEAARAAGQMVRNGLAKDGVEAMDLLTRGFQEGADMAGDLLDTFSEYSTQFRELGINGQQAMGLIIQMMRAGARDADTAADAIKEFAIRSKDGSKESAAAFQALGLDASKMFATFAAGGPGADAAMKTVLDRLKAIEDPAARNAAAVALFGTKAEDLGQALYAMDPTNAVAMLGQVGGAAQAMGDQLHNTAAAKLEGFKRAVEEGMAQAGAAVIAGGENIVNWLSEKLAPLRPVVDELIMPAFRRISDFFEEKLIPAFRKLQEQGLNAIIGAFETIKASIDSHREQIGQLVDAYEKFATFIVERIWPILGPIFALVVATVVQLIIFVISYISFWVDTWNWLWRTVTNIAAWFAGPFADFFVSGYQRVAGATGAVRDWVVNAWNSVVGFVAGLPGRITAAAGGMWNGIVSAFRGAINAIIGGWNRLSFTVGGGNVFGKDIPSFTIDTPDVPYLARGGVAGGLAAINERGAELVRLPQGSTVIPHGTSEQILAANAATTAGNINVYVYPTPLASPVDIGREIAEALAQYEQVSGSRWRSA